MRDQRLVLTLAGLLFAARMSASEPLISYEVSVSDLAARTGLATTARSVATTYGGVIDPRSIDETNGTFVIHIRRGSVALMRADSRIKTVRSVARPPSTESLPPSAWDYAYDGSGNIKEINTDHFRYDLAGRLTSGMVNGTTNKQTFTYDGFGNRTGASRPSGASQCVASTQCEMSAPVETTNTNRLASTQASFDDAGARRNDKYEPAGIDAGKLRRRWQRNDHRRHILVHLRRTEHAAPRWNPRFHLHAER